ncbi:MAG: hypothetical protein WAZ68_06070 [Leptotrichiaceae bacterium]|jgi:antitoxin component YwqK of YwqJK toxin-antitoxin module
MKKIILAILMITSILTLSEEKTITENNGTLIKKYNSDGILIEVVNNEAEDLGVVKSVEKLSDDGKVYEKLEYQISYYVDSDENMGESDFEHRSLSSYIDDNQDKFNKLENLDYYELSERANNKKINVSKNILILNKKSKFISEETLNLEKLNNQNGTYELYSSSGKLLERKEYKGGILNGEYYLAAQEYIPEFRTKIENGNATIMEYYNSVDRKSAENNIEYMYSKGEIKNGIKVGEWEFYGNTYIVDGNTKVIKSGIGRYENGTLLNFKVDEEYRKNDSWSRDYEFYPNGSVKKTQKIDAGIIEELLYGENGIDYSFKQIREKTNEIIYEFTRKLTGNILTIDEKISEDKETIDNKLIYEFTSPQEIVFEKNEWGEVLVVKNANIKYYKNGNLIEELNIKNGRVWGRHYYNDVINGVEKKQDIDFGNSENIKYIGILYNYIKIDKDIFNFTGIDLSNREVIEGNLADGKKNGSWEEIIVYLDVDGRVRTTTTNSIYKNGKLQESNEISKDDENITISSYNSKYDDNEKEIYYLKTENTENTENKEMFYLNDNEYVYKEIIDNKEVREVRYKSKFIDEIYLFSSYDTYQTLPTITGKLTLLFDNKLAQVINYKDRLFDGEYIAYKDGKEYYKTNFNNGTGYYKDYDEGSKSSNEGKFVEGLRDGLWKRTYYFDEIKGETTIERVYSMGILQSEKSDYQMKKYENGNLIYDASDYDEEEKKYETENYLSDDKKTIFLKRKNYDERDEEVTFESSGSLLGELEYLTNTSPYEEPDTSNIADVKITKKIDGITIVEENRKDGLLNGNYVVNNYYGKELYKTKFENGTGYYKEYSYDQLIKEGKMVSGKKEGEWKEYNGDVNKNEKTSTSIYKNDKLIESRSKNIFLEITTKYNLDKEGNENPIYREINILDTKKVDKIEGNIVYKYIYTGKKLIKEERFEVDEDSMEDDKELSLDDISIGNTSIKGKYSLYINNVKRAEINYGGAESLPKSETDEDDMDDYSAASVPNIIDGDYIIYDKNGSELYKTKFENGTGYYKKYNENDELISEGGSKDNLKEGIWKKYFSGKLTSEITYEKDVNVSEITYYSNGQIESKRDKDKIEKFYKNGKIYEIEDLNNPEDNAVLYYENGNIMKSSEVKDKAKEENIEKEFYFSGNIKRERYSKGGFLVKEIMYYENNQKKHEINYSLQKPEQKPEVEKNDKTTEESKKEEEKSETDELIQVVSNVQNGKYIVYSQDGKVLYETEFVNGTGTAKYYTNQGKEISESEYVNGELKKGYIILPITNEKIEYNFDSVLLNKEFQKKLNEAAEEAEKDVAKSEESEEEVVNESVTETSVDNKNQPEIPENINFSMIKAYNSKDKLTLEVKYTDKGFEIDYRKNVINIKNPNFSEIQEIMKNIIEGKKIEFFFQIVGAILDKEGLAVNVYYPEKKKDISLKVSRNTIENYIRLLIGSSDEETLYDQLTSKSDAKVEQYYPNGKIKSRITLVNGFYINQQEYDEKGKLFYQSKANETALKEFYGNGKIKLELDIEELDLLNIKLYNELGQQIALENYYEMENPIYNLLHEWLK